MQIISNWCVALFCAVALTGCIAPPAGPDNAVVDAPDAANGVGNEASVEEFPFPDYLLLSDFKLLQYGYILQTPLIGVDIQTRLQLEVVRRRLRDVITAKGWTIAQAEERGSSFRLMAFSGAETLEIRAVQGSGPAQILILYRPAAVAADDAFGSGPRP